MLKIIEIVSNLISKLRNSANGKCECDYINGAETLPPPLSKEEEAKTLAKLNTDFENARETLIVHNLRLVVYIAKKFESTGIGIEDLISIGTIGLIKAIETYNIEKHKARYLCLKVHRKRNTYVSEENESAKNGGFNR